MLNGGADTTGRSGPGGRGSVARGDVADPSAAAEPDSVGVR
jgi:hypothetical protein